MVTRRSLNAARWHICPSASAVVGRIDGRTKDERREPPHNITAVRVVRLFVQSGHNSLGIAHLRSAARGRVADRDVRTAIYRKRTARLKCACAKRGERRRGKLPEGANTLELRSYVHGVSIGFIVVLAITTPGSTVPDDP